MNTESKWLATLGKLRVNRSQGLAPHNDPKNGIALCKNAHWLFDQGLWSLDDDYRVIVAHSAFDESTRDQKSLRDFHGLRVALPANNNLWPDRQHLAWHREHKFCA